jgi:hypothetical protein
MKKTTRIGIAAAFGVATAMAFPASTIAQPGYIGARPDAAGGMTSQSDVPGSHSQSGSSGLLFESPAAPEPRGAMTEPSDRYGSPAGNQIYDREIKLAQYTRSVGVKHNETVKFVAPDGHEFRWRFDTLRTTDVFPLARITPPDIPVGTSVAVYINGNDPSDSSNLADPLAARRT